MGLDFNGVQFILYAKTRGVDFTRTAMIGRQALFINSFDFETNLIDFGFSYDANLIERIFPVKDPFAEEFFRSLGAEGVHSFDHSDYEGATHVHDMNAPIKENVKKQYSAVFDGGSLEHVFNFPVAMKNCLEMVQVGGHFLSLTPANNFLGHGFYQFSPEILFRIFTPENGYELECLIAFEDSPGAPWYQVINPASLQRRVTLLNNRPVYLATIARRVNDVVPFQSMPQQSDYVSAWKGKTPGVDSGKPRPLLTAIGRYTPQTIKRLITRLSQFFRKDKHSAGFDPLFFTPLERTDGVSSPAKTLRSPNQRTF